jgi:transcriptional regulator with PAS, ATPase and Fis domain
VNIAALSGDLLESELFGHRRGAFSGAHADHPGLFVAAHRGTLMLDEIAELPPEAQAKLLRVLQDGEVRPVGGLESRKVDVRMIAATNRSVRELRSGALRQDLFFRLSVLIIQVPPLRERPEDIPRLVEHFLTRGRHGSALSRLTPEALDLLARYQFPGNVRELENLVENLRATLPADQPEIRAEDARTWFRRQGTSIAPSQVPAGDKGSLPLNLGELEAWAIRSALVRSGGNKSRAAQILGISRDSLYRKLHELGDLPSDSLTLAARRSKQSL